MFIWLLRDKDVSLKPKMQTSEEVNAHIRMLGDKFFAVIDSPSNPNCRFFRETFPQMSKPDGDMDIAFTLVVHKDIWQIARLLRMIHRVNNYYCIHLDSRSPRVFRDALVGVAACFGPNVEIVPEEKRVEVNWGDESVLRPQLICAEQALKRSFTWKYLVNIVGQEFPLRTNLELQAALKALNGSNLVESFSINRFRKWVKNISLPYGANWYKGTVYGAFRREFLQEAVLDEFTKPFRDLLLLPKVFNHPDELFFSTLNYNPHLKLTGSCMVAPSPPNEVNINFLAKYVIWGDYNIKCETKLVRSVCIFGNPQVAQLQRTPHLFANKFHSDYQSEAYDKMERWYFNKFAKEIETGVYSKSDFDVSVYANRTCSHNNIRNEKGQNRF
nr:glycosyltransferase 14 family member [Hymenolepis microstoma]